MYIVELRWGYLLLSTKRCKNIDNILNIKIKPAKNW